MQWKQQFQPQGLKFVPINTAMILLRRWLQKLDETVALADLKQFPRQFFELIHSAVVSNALLMPFINSMIHGTVVCPPQFKFLPTQSFDQIKHLCTKILTQSHGSVFTTTCIRYIFLLRIDRFDRNRKLTEEIILKNRLIDLKAMFYDFQLSTLINIQDHCTDQNPPPSLSQYDTDLVFVLKQYFQGNYDKQFLSMMVDPIVSSFSAVVFNDIYSNLMKAENFGLNKLEINVLLEYLNFTLSRDKFIDCLEEIPQLSNVLLLMRHSYDVREILFKIVDDFQCEQFIFPKISTSIYDFVDYLHLIKIQVISIIAEDNLLMFSQDLREMNVMNTYADLYRKARDVNIECIYLNFMILYDTYQAQFLEHYYEIVYYQPLEILQLDRLFTNQYQQLDEKLLQLSQNINLLGNYLEAVILLSQLQKYRGDKQVLQMLEIFCENAAAQRNYSQLEAEEARRYELLFQRFDDLLYDFKMNLQSNVPQQQQGNHAQLSTELFQSKQPTQTQKEVVMLRAQIAELINDKVENYKQLQQISIFSSCERAAAHSGLQTAITQTKLQIFKDKARFVYLTQKMQLICLILVKNAANSARILAFPDRFRTLIQHQRRENLQLRLGSLTNAVQQQMKITTEARKFAALLRISVELAPKVLSQFLSKLSLKLAVSKEIKKLRAFSSTFQHIKISQNSFRSVFAHDTETINQNLMNYKFFEQKCIVSLLILNKNINKKVQISTKSLQVIYSNNEIEGFGKSLMRVTQKQTALQTDILKLGESIQKTVVAHNIDEKIGSIIVISGSLQEAIAESEKLFSKSTTIRIEKVLVEKTTGVSLDLPEVSTSLMNNAEQQQLADLLSAYDEDLTKSQKLFHQNGAKSIQITSTKLPVPGMKERMQDFEPEEVKNFLTELCYTDEDIADIIIVISKQIQKQHVEKLIQVATLAQFPDLDTPFKQDISLYQAVFSLIKNGKF